MKFLFANIQDLFQEFIGNISVVNALKNKTTKNALN